MTLKWTGLGTFAVWIGVFLLFGAFIAKAETSENRSSKVSGTMADCLHAGWSQQSITIQGYQRSLLWQVPSTGWRNGAILVLHGGGGDAAHFCGGGRLVAPQIDFTRRALQRGFAVFLLDSAADLTRGEFGNSCGKRFDFSAPADQNNDLAFIRHIIQRTIPRLRTATDNPSIFMTGISNGAFMSVRAATELNGAITAIAPVSAGDPYGTYLDCRPGQNKRKQAPGTYRDRETRLSIKEERACFAIPTRNELPWPRKTASNTTAFKQFYHSGDGIIDISCKRKLQTQLSLHHYTTEAPFVIQNRGRKSIFKHLWRDDYNEPILDFFAKNAKPIPTR